MLTITQKSYKPFPFVPTQKKEKETINKESNFPPTQMVLSEPPNLEMTSEMLEVLDELKKHEESWTTFFMTLGDQVWNAPWKVPKMDIQKEWEFARGLLDEVLHFHPNKNASDRPFARWHHLLLQPASFRVFLSCPNYGFCRLNRPGITKFKYEKSYLRNSKMTPSCKWPIISSSYYRLPSSFNHKPPSEFYLLWRSRIKISDSHEWRFDDSMSSFSNFV